MNASRLVPFLALIACAAPRSSLAGGECSRSGPYSLQVVDEAGRVLPTFHHQGSTYVLGAQGGRYLLRVHNDSGRRVEVVASVDGRDVVDGKPSALARRGYLVDPHGDLTIDGFRLSGAAVAAFRFGAVADSYAARMGDARDVGVIGVAVFAEAQRPPPQAQAPRPPPQPMTSRAEGSRERSDDAQPPASAPAAKGEASSMSERSTRDRSGLGTTFGEEHESHVLEVAFERASARPEALLTVRYDDRQGLLALGIDVDGARVSSRERRLRQSAEPFRRDGDFAAPPPGWTGR